MYTNKQPIEKSIDLVMGRLEVHSIFDTIQGEGPFAGTPATFVRTSGCNLRCSFCDTDYTSQRKVYSPVDLMREIDKLPRRELIVLTGGEPFRQDFSPFTHEVSKSRKKLQVETNGTLFFRCVRDGLHNVRVFRDVLTVVCSPKTPKIDYRMWMYIDDLKYVVQAGKIDFDGLPLSSVGPQYGRPARPPEWWSGEIYVQPLDEQDQERNKRNQDAAVLSCMEHGHRLCLQTHKMVGLK